MSSTPEVDKLNERIATLEKAIKFYRHALSLDSVNRRLSATDSIIKRIEYLSILCPAIVADAFCKWPLPDSVCADPCATKQGPGRTGTNLMSWVEAKQMAEEIVAPMLKLVLANVAVQHPDEVAVDKFSAAMKAKLEKKREQGYYGWDDKNDCSHKHLVELLHQHIEKGDPVDVGNFAMMLWNRGEQTKIEGEKHGQAI